MVLDVLNELRVADTIYNFSAFYVTITVFTASRHVISVEATSITFTSSHSSSFRFVLILSYDQHAYVQTAYFALRFSYKNFVHNS
jgi:hypothetical protein